MRREEHITEAIPAYALGCLESEEAVQVAGHLAVCEVCRQELESYRRVVARMPYAVPEMNPPEGLKNRLMGQIRQGPVSSGDRQGESVSFWDRLAALFGQASALGFASFLVILLLAASNFLLWQQVTDLRESADTSLQTISLRGDEAAPLATGLIVVSMDGEHGTLVVDALPELDESRQYQLWLIENGERTSGGVFSVSEEGYGSVWVNSPQPLVEYSAFGVTIEPAGGSPGPTGERVLFGEL